MNSFMVLECTKSSGSSNLTLFYTPKLSSSLLQHIYQYLLRYTFFSLFRFSISINIQPQALYIIYQRMQVIKKAFPQLKDQYKLSRFAQ